MGAFEYDYDIHDEPCPACGHSPTHWKRCDAIGCDDGFIDLHEYDDPINFSPGEMERCPECHGRGLLVWCPACGFDLLGRHDNDYSGFYNVVGDHFNIEAVCPDYMPECQWAFTWYRDEMGVAVVSGYAPEDDPDAHWLCVCGHFETGGCCCTSCGHEPPWGCIGCGAQDDDYDEDMDFGDFDPHDLEMREPDFDEE